MVYKVNHEVHEERCRDARFCVSPDIAWIKGQRVQVCNLNPYFNSTML
ncbi:MAG: hypothetical protein JETT_3505 [Candidatus Jettenia ecosi]|uniref:Uncharacterized protein n=1 Tax=Candidatus Jettenia ecosi TaxID=2494326 RepID=A0A533Q6J5_9BACT|nr:MAG: hypothetical protein JETT_3505 [Candidatus Jettenia ecosi]